MSWAPLQAVLPRGNIFGIGEIDQWGLLLIISTSFAHIINWEIDLKEVLYMITVFIPSSYNAKDKMNITIANVAVNNVQQQSVQYLRRS